MMKLILPRCQGLLLAVGLLAFHSPVAYVQSPSLDAIIAHARAAVSRYVGNAALLLADEQCTQQVFESVLDTETGGVLVQPRGRRRWTAEMALVPIQDLAADGYPWTEFRDVLIVDGRAVNGREERLSSLFLQRPAQSISPERARAILEHGARFNLGPARNANTPWMPLLILHPANEGRCDLHPAG
jgi:hypothetical protein